MAGERTIKVRFEGSSKGLDKATEGARKSLDKVTETADEVDTKAMGFRDTMTGVQDSIKGFSDIAKGDLFTGFLTLGMGIGDLASGVFNFLGPMAGVIRQTKLWAIAQGILNTVMSLNPISLVVIAVVALIAIFVVAYKKSETFRRIVTAAWDGIKAAAQAVASWFTDTLWPWIKGVWDRVQGGASTMVANVKAQFAAWKRAAVAVKDGIVSAFNRIVGFIRGLPGKIGHAASGMFNGIKNAFRSAVNWIIGKWNGLYFRLGGKHVSLPFGKSFDIPSVTLNTPNIGYLARGGDALAGRTYMVGERGPELLTMGSRSGHVTPNNALGGSTEVRVFIGDQELKGIVRTEVSEVNRGIRRAALAGTGGAR